MPWYGCANLLAMTLSTEQLARYNEDGFLIVSDFVNTASCDRLRARAEDEV